MNIQSVIQDMPPPALIRRVVLISFVVISVTMRSMSHRSEKPVVNAPLVVKTPSATQQHRTTQALRGPEKKSAFQFGLAVAHCDEDFMTWIDEIDDVTLPDEHGKPQKATWDAVVYERCGQNVSPKYSKWQRNIGSEECTAYLQYIIDRYDELPEIVYFLQPDSMGFNEVKDNQHTNFTSLQDLVAASAPLMKADTSIGYLALGKDLHSEATKVVQRENTVNNNPEEVLQLMKERAPAYEDDSVLNLIPGACFAVSRERILAQPSEFYKDLILAALENEDERRLCWSLEATWHVVFGEPLAIPYKARIMHHLTHEAAEIS